MDGRSRTCAALTVILLVAVVKAAKGDHAARRNVMAVADLSGLVDSIPPPIQGRKYGIVVVPGAFGFGVSYLPEEGPGGVEPSTSGNEQSGSPGAPTSEPD